MKSTDLLRFVLVLALIPVGCELGLAKASEPIHDIAITNISVPSDCTQGESVPVTVSITNQGTRRDRFRVTLIEDTSRKEIASQEVALSKGWKNGPKKSSSKDVGGATVVDQIFPCPTKGSAYYGDHFEIGDVNNDGYDDLLVTASQWNNKLGRVYFYYGGINMDNFPDKIFTGENVGDEFGEAGIALFDMNNDGYDDVLIGARSFDNSTGRVYIFWGGSDMDTDADIIIDGETKDSRFGREVTAGDLNGDGYLDLIVGANKFDDYKGRAYIYFGPVASDTGLDLTITGENTNDTFAHYMCARGDVDGDGCDDLLIGTMYYPQNTCTGRAYLYYGGLGNTMDNVCDVYFDAENEGDEFASAVDLYDIDNDGKAEVLISAREYGDSQGRTYLYWGKNRESMNNTPNLIFEGEIGAASSFGSGCIHGGDFNNDDYGDIVVSAYNYPNKIQVGRSYIYLGNNKTSMNTDCDYIFQGVHQHAGIFRTRIGDFNGDNYGDIIMGGWKYNNFQGRCWLWYGGPESSTDITFNWDTTNASLGKHILKASISPVAGEENTADNTATVSVEVEDPS